MSHEMTDMELSERVCRALGIEPLGKDLPNGLRRDLLDIPHYPSVLDWPGFGRVVERLDECGFTPWAIEAVKDQQDELWYHVSAPRLDETVRSQELPRALALAVVAWEASR